ncbi:MAG: hypothetical protein KJ044_01935, partial [Planctomycetes bacterium]|nr:hypothetical protein [Planctomycetota bacterium]
LLIHLGRPGWDTKFARELMALVPRPSWDVAELLDGELAGMLDESRRLFLGKDAAGIGKVPAGEADPDAWMAGQIDSATDTIGAVNQAIVELRDKPARADTADGMARLTAVLKRMGEAGASEDARYVVSHPLRCAVRESLYWAAIELRLADLEKPLAGRIQDGRKLLERFPGLKLKLDGKTPVVFIDPDAEWQKQLSFAQENEIRIEARAAR